MVIIVNGREIDFKDNLTVAELLKQLNIDEKKSVVELNKKIISDFNVVLKEKDKIEIIRMVGGG